MDKKITFLLITLISLTVFGQSATELNEQSKKFIETKEFDKALPLLKQAAQLGNAESQYNLGYCYEAGIVVPKNAEKAMEWYYESAEQGYNDALYKMMMAYGTGNGADLNHELAFQYATKCANNNDATCMFNLINCYKQGMGTAVDLDKMLEWAIKLGKLKNYGNLELSGRITSARLNLAYMYRDGIDVEKDEFKSYLWFLIYNEFKRDFSYLQQQSVVKEIQELEVKLNKEQKKIAQSEAEKILERPLENMGNLYKAEM